MSTKSKNWQRDKHVSKAATGSEVKRNKKRSKMKKLRSDAKTSLSGEAEQTFDTSEQDQQDRQRLVDLLDQEENQDEFENQADQDSDRQNQDEPDQFLDTQDSATTQSRLSRRDDSEPPKNLDLELQTQEFGLWDDYDPSQKLSKLKEILSDEDKAIAWKDELLKLLSGNRRNSGNHVDHRRSGSRRSESDDSKEHVHQKCKDRHRKQRVSYSDSEDTESSNLDVYEKRKHKRQHLRKNRVHRDKRDSSDSVESDDEKPQRHKRQKIVEEDSSTSGSESERSDPDRQNGKRGGHSSCKHHPIEFTDDEKDTRHVIRQHVGGLTKFDPLANLLSAERKTALKRKAEGGRPFYPVIGETEKPMMTGVKSMQDRDARLYKEMEECCTLCLMQMQVLH
jgi:hypothetical protein